MANFVDDNKVKEILDQDALEIIGASNLTEEKKEELYLKMADTINNRVVARIFDLLNEHESSELDTALDENDAQKISTFLTRKNINIDEMILQETMIYKSELADLAKLSKEE